MEVVGMTILDFHTNFPTVHWRDAVHTMEEDNSYCLVAALHPFRTLEQAKSDGKNI
jgi:hypothetical protein